MNADAFVLSANRLKEIGQKVAEIYPSCKTISMYASINNIKSKTDEELKDLRALNFNDFINATKARLIFVANLHVDEGTPLFASRQKGHFVENTVRRNVQEFHDLFLDSIPEKDSEGRIIKP